MKHERSKEVTVTPLHKKRKRGKTNRENKNDDINDNDFNLDNITKYLCQDIPHLLNVRDEQLSLALLDGMQRVHLDDMVSWFLRGEGIDSDEKQCLGPPKWNYTEGDYFDSFDFYTVSGCPNCGSSYELEHPYALHLNPPMLVCLQCGHRACQLHFRGETESVIERWKTGLEKNSESKASLSFDASSKPFSDSAVYIRGSREQYNFGQKGKEWWKSRYLPRSVRSISLNRIVTMVSMMSTLKAPTMQEVCEMCSNTTAYYTTFQARSADEGMTIMYECTRCHHRKTFNN